MRTLTINQMHSIATKRDGKCLSVSYKNARSNLLWKCTNGHTWEATPDNIKRGTWCPYCKNIDHIGEEQCRYIFEWLTNLQFPKSRQILNNRQELDGYCEEINIAFEFNGVQHYKYVQFFHSSKKAFIYQQSRDKTKQQACDSKNISLIIVPYNVNDMIGFIYAKLIALGIGARSDLVNFSFSNLRKKTSRLIRCQDFAKEKGWKCLSLAFINGQSKIEWECSNSHTWKASWDNIKRGSGCPECSKITLRNRFQKYTISDMRELAKARKGNCLSKEYTNCKIHLEWSCSNGHVWCASPEKTINGQWCRQCRISPSMI